MIKEFIERFEVNKNILRTAFAEAHPDSYKEIVQGVIRAIQGESEYDAPSPNRIHEIDDGDYQGTLVYVIAAGGYQPDDYWYVKVGYGSCSGCDTLQAISGYSDEKPNDSQIEQYMTLATHILQGLKKMGDDNQTGPY
jgi:hypothetical protein